MTGQSLKRLAGASLFSHIHAETDLAERTGGASWSVDLSAPEITFRSAAGEQRFPVQLIGSISQSAGTWMWGWHNTNHFPDAALALAEEVFLAGERDEISELTTAVVALHETPSLLLQLAAETIGVANHWISVDAGNSVTVVLAVDAGPLPAPDHGQLLTTVLRGIELQVVDDHYDALRAYGERLGIATETLDGEVRTLRLATVGVPTEATFDADGRMLSIHAARDAQASASESGPDAADAERAIADAEFDDEASPFGPAAFVFGGSASDTDEPANDEDAGPSSAASADDAPMTRRARRLAIDEPREVSVEPMVFGGDPEATWNSAPRDTGDGFGAFGSAGVFGASEAAPADEGRPAADAAAEPAREPGDDRSARPAPPHPSMPSPSVPQSSSTSMPHPPTAERVEPGNMNPQPPAASMSGPPAGGPPPWTPGPQSGAPFTPGGAFPPNPAGRPMPQRGPQPGQFRYGGTYGNAGRSDTAAPQPGVAPDRRPQWGGPGDGQQPNPGQGRPPQSAPNGPYGTGPGPYGPSTPAPGAPQGAPHAPQPSFPQPGHAPGSPAQGNPQPGDPRFAGGPNRFDQRGPYSAPQSGPPPLGRAHPNPYAQPGAQPNAFPPQPNAFPPQQFDAPAPHPGGPGPWQGELNRSASGGPAPWPQQGQPNPGYGQPQPRTPRPSGPPAAPPTFGTGQPQSYLPPNTTGQQPFAPPFPPGPERRDGRPGEDGTGQMGPGNPRR